MKKWLIISALFAGGFYLFISTLQASELTFKFTNPSFGGEPLYGTFFLQEAQLQNDFQKKSSSYKPKSLLDRFTESFTSQLLYRMANLMLNQIFGEDNTLPETEQIYTVGNFRIHFIPETDKYIFEITDLSSGQITILEMPKMI